jgi:hypothetical protein
MERADALNTPCPPLPCVKCYAAEFFYDSAANNQSKPFACLNINANQVSDCKWYTSQ